MTLIKKIEKLGYKVVPMGDGFKMVCPFHPDNDPSCIVKPSADYFKCFGCGEYGKLSKLLQKLNIDVEFYDVQFLSGVKTRLLNKIGSALGEFSPIPVDAMPINSTIRGISPETFKFFNVYTDELHKGSLMFPIFFRSKYRGVIEYKPSSGYVTNFTNNYIPYNADRVNSTNVILVEGVFDALSVYQAGYKSVMASLSASYSKAILSWLHKLSIQHVYILYDGDAAGRKAAKLLHVKFPDSTVIDMPESSDPNSLDNLKDFLLSKGVN